jgi:hypothetical protein
MNEMIQSLGNIVGNWDWWNRKGVVDDDLQYLFASLGEGASGKGTALEGINRGLKEYIQGLAARRDQKKMAAEMQEALKLLPYFLGHKDVKELYKPAEPAQSNAMSSKTWLDDYALARGGRPWLGTGR